jgi:[glutamine synthetase] adenylyltransferase / [glutamine synthetase]-adenylyl-L-tyrosine phosphorylase
LYMTLAEKKFRTSFITICARSSRVARILTTAPGLTEMMMTDLRKIISASLPAVSSYSSLYGWKVQTETSAAIRYSLGESDEKSLFEYLSAIASAVLGVIYAEKLEELGLSAEEEFCILGLGKLGGEEMNFDSDLDIILLCRPRNNEDTSVFENLSYKIIEAATQTTASGALYSVDARLRPEGRSAPLVVTADAYTTYLRKRASVWERQSLTRARFIAGNADFAKKILEAINQSVYGSPFPTGWQKEIFSMRRKTEHRSRATTSEFVDLKLGAGGLMDIEFCIQALQLARASNAFQATNIFRLLELFKEDEQYADVVAVLQKNYLLLRKIETLLRLALDTQSNVLSADDVSLNYLALLCDFRSGKELLASLRSAMKENRTVFRDVIESIA